MRRARGWGEGGGRGAAREITNPECQSKPDVPGSWALIRTCLAVVCEEPAPSSSHLSPDKVQRQQIPKVKGTTMHLQQTAPCLARRGEGWGFPSSSI